MARKTLKVLRQLCLISAAISVNICAIAASFEDAQQQYEKKNYREAIEILKPLAAEANPRAQSLLGFMLINGSGISKDVQEGLRLLKAGAAAGNPGAQAFLALQYFYGEHIHRDLVRARELSEASANQNSPIGLYVLGLTQMRSRNLEERSNGIESLKRAVEQNFPVARYELGLATAIGWVAAKDAQNGFSNIEQAVNELPQLKGRGDLIKEMQDRFSQFATEEFISLGCDGFVCAGRWGANRADARRFYLEQAWPELIATVLKVDFQSDLTYYYLGVAADGMGFHRASLRYFDAAIRARLKCNSFINNCDGLDVPRLANASVHQIKLELQAQEESEQRRLTQRRQEEAEALRLAKDEQQRQAEQKELDDLVASASSGVGISQFLLALRFFDGRGVQKSNESGLVWLRRAVDSDVPGAQVALAIRYLRGDGLPHDEIRAEALLKRASAKGNQIAKTLLADLAEQRTVRQRQEAEYEAERRRKFEAHQREQERQRLKESSEKVKSL